MIRCSLEQTPSGKWLRYTAKGHSDHAACGYDIVCAAVSVLGSTCVNSLEACCGIKVEFSANDVGILSFALPERLNEAQSHDAQLLFSAMVQGLRDIAAQYPKDLQITLTERRESR